MKKYLLLTIIITLLTNNIKSQDENFLSLCVGAALPQGTFASKNFSNESAGYATSGFLFGFDMAWFPDDYLGIGGTVTFVNNNIDKKKYEEDLLKRLLEKYPDLELPDNTEIYFDMSEWRYVNLMIGPNGTFNAGKFNFDLRALTGISFVFPPGTELQIKQSGEQILSTNHEKKVSLNLGFTLGAGIRYALKNNYVIRLIAEYTGTKGTFDVTEDISKEVIGGDITLEPQTRKVDYPVNNIQLGIGIAYHFGL